MVKKASMRKMTEDLAEVDAVSDTLWDLRGAVCTVMKKKGYLDKETACYEIQGTIDGVIRRLVDYV